MASEPILIVDDNAANIKLASFLLSVQGYDVKTAVDAADALRALETFRPRLILMDLQLPGMDGLSLTRLLRTDENTREILIVALTSYAMKGDEERARAAGCDGYITKPINTRTFPLTIASFLAADSVREPAR